MKIFVCIKQVPDTETKIKVNSDASSIDEAGVKWVMNPYDEIAVEEALQLKAANAGATVTVVSLGPKARVMNTVRSALAMGADEGLLIDCQQALDTHATAKALANAIKAEGDFSVVFTGKLAIDDNAASVSQMVAEFLDIPHTTVVSKFESADGQFTVEREVEGGTREVVQLTGPSVIGANKGLNTPRYAKLPEIMKAKKKPVKEVAFDSVGVTAEDIKVVFSNYQLPPEKPAVKMIDGDAGSQASQLVTLLRDEAKVL